MTALFIFSDVEIHLAIYCNKYANTFTAQYCSVMTCHCMWCCPCSLPLYVQSLPVATVLAVHVCCQCTCSLCLLLLYLQSLLPLYLQSMFVATVLAQIMSSGHLSFVLDTSSILPSSSRSPVSNSSMCWSCHIGGGGMSRSKSAMVVSKFLGSFHTAPFL